MKSAVAAAAAAWSIARSLVERSAWAVPTAKAALEMANAPADDEDGRRELASVLRGEIASCLRSVGIRGAAPKATDASARDSGILRYDERFSRFLESFGDLGRDVAAVVRVKAAERWKNYEVDGDAEALWSLWIADAEKPRFAVTLAYALWLTRVEESVKRSRGMPGALARPILEAVVELTSSSRSREYNRRNRSLTFDGRSIATHGALDEEIVLKEIEPGLRILRGIVGHRVLRWCVLHPHRQFLAGHHRPEVIHVEGGSSDLRAQLGLSSKAHDRAVREVIDALAQFSFTLPNGGHGNLIARQWYPASPRLVVTVGEPLLPQYQRKLQGRDRMLIPMLRNDPPFFSARPNERGAEITMALALLSHVRVSADEYAQTGMVQLTFREGWAPIADRAGVPRRKIHGIVERWIEGTDSARPLLEKRGQDRYTLGAALSVERAYILAGAKRAERDET